MIDTATAQAKLPFQKYRHEAAAILPPGAKLQQVEQVAYELLRADYLRAVQPWVQIKSNVLTYVPRRYTVNAEGALMLEYMLTEEQKVMLQQCDELITATARSMGLDPATGKGVQP